MPHVSRVQQQTNSHNNRGASPVPSAPATTSSSIHPMRVHNSAQIQHQLQQQLQTMQSLSMFPVDGSSSEPPPPYPMGTAAITANPPPSYSQSLAMRGSPTLSSTSSDYRRSPAPQTAQPLTSIYPHHILANSPIPPSPSPSVLSSSSQRTTNSSLQPWPSRQATSHSPIIMQSVKSTQVQKPILQTATTPVQDVLAAAGATGGDCPPPSYEFSIQQKQQQQQRSPATVPRAMPTPEPKKAPPALPPPPPYPSTAVSGCVDGLVNGSSKQAHVGTAKVVKQLPRRYSPLPSETGSSTAASRSESPVSDSQTVSAASPLSFGPSDAALTPDSGFDSNPASVVTPTKSASTLMPPPPPPPYKTTHHTSPKPERRNISPAKEAARREFVTRNCPPQAFKFFMEQHVENIIKEYDQRRQRQMRLERELVQYGIKDKHMKEQMREVLRRKETNYLRMRRAKLNKNHFKKLKTIGIGAFGEVSLVRSVNGVGNSKSGGLYAMKTLKKSHVVERKQVAHVIAEKDILAEADNDWIVKLYYSFQV